ncbi:MAG: PilC/PilY family type IV pilus protein [Thermoanaerobaculia bacterium]
MTRMTRSKRQPTRRRAARAAVLTVALVSAVLAVQRAKAADDVDLLRVNGGNPYVLVLLDTSASMALLPPDLNDKGDLGPLAAANGDDRNSKLFQAKQALYEVLSAVENVNFGLVEFNKDHPRVLRKHWLYAPQTSVNHFSSFTYPVATPSDPSDRDKLETMWVFGEPPAGLPEAGTCAAPIAFSTNDKDNTDIQLNRFPKDIASSGTARQWIEVSNTTYLLEVSADSGALGDATVDVRVTLSEVLTCSPLSTALPVTDTVVSFERVTDFLMVEGDLTGANDPGVESGPFDMTNNQTDPDECTADETIAGFLDFQDMAADGTCGHADRPFTGLGSESNQDSENGPDAADDLDTFCWDTSAGSCYNLRYPTQADPRFPELDTGDFLPLNWQVDHREEFLSRLNPRHPEYDPNRPEDYFGIARFFRDTPDSQAGIVRLRNEGEKPIVAFGNSPWTRTLTDLRCWYNSSDSNRCKTEPKVYPDGFESLFREHDEFYECRIPYLITITDSEENGEQVQNFASVYNDLDDSHGMRNWIFSFQDHQDFQRIESNANGTVVLVSDKDELKTELQRVIGEITQATRTFATAAVPSVQTAVENQIYLTKFQPLNDAGVWEGHLHAFTRPMPQDQTDPPNRDYPNWVWDSALSMLDQSSQPASDGDNSTVDLKIDTSGGNENRRRVLWGRERLPGGTDTGEVPMGDELLLRTSGTSSGAATALERDFWDGLEIPYDTNDQDSVDAARSRANRIVEETLLQKESPLTSDTDDLDWYILGEVFHSNPVIVGAPVNTRYFVEDAEETFDGDGTELGTGYREFFNRHENRRKVVMAGANDGMLHAFDAGRAEVDDTANPPEVAFGLGTGKEVFSFIPREVLPTVKLQAENPEAHRWSVDGSPVAGDVFIDPVHDGAPADGDREWRTVVVTGLREGGSGYFALDVTHPDPLKEDTVGPEGSERTVLVPDDPDKVVPPCYATTGDGDLGCDDDLTYPRPLWEFSDRVWDSTTLEWVRLDEEDLDDDGVSDGNEFADLGETWSEPDIGRIQVVEGGEVVNKYVAVFGGGLDPAKAASRGNWLYIVDIETGQAIYKRELEGSAPSDPAAVDTDQDGFFDRVYIGTTAGFLYRLDLVEVDSNGDPVFPALVSRDACGINGICNYTVTRFERGADPADPLWAPKKIFDTAGRPIYFPPAALFVANLGEFAVAFGTGDRDSLTAKSNAPGRFYLFVDESEELADTDLPMTESNFEQIDRDEGDNTNLLTDPNLSVGEKGWFLVLETAERLIGDPFGFSGITFFATFDSRIDATCSVDCTNDDSDCTECSSDENPECTLGGRSRVYVVGTTDADAFLEDSSGNLVRSFDIEGQFVTSPFTEQAVTSTQNTEDDSSEDDSGGEDDSIEADPLSESEQKLMQKLRELFPEQCKFGNHRIDVKVVRADSELERVAAVPICIVEKNWKEVTE